MCDHQYIVNKRQFKPWLTVVTSLKSALWNMVNRNVKRILHLGGYNWLSICEPEGISGKIVAN